MNIQEQRKKLLNRLKILRGQMAGVHKMVGENAYCVDVIRQSLAIQKSLQSFNQQMLEWHLYHHAKDQFKFGEHEKAIKELLEIYSLKNK
jgi:CsoR family transcriptional regulator, copper-sensing transcriptional repressor